MRNLGSIVKQAQIVQDRIVKMQEELAAMTIDGQAGGNMVIVTFNGKQELQKIKIDPSVVDPGEVEMLEDLVVAACNDAMKKVQELTREMTNRATGGMQIPGMNWPL